MRPSTTAKRTAETARRTEISAAPIQEAKSLSAAAMKKVLTEVFGYSLKKHRLHGRTFAQVYRAQPLARIEVIKRGVAATAVDGIASAMGSPQETVIRNLGISKSTLARKRQQRAPLEKEQSELVVGLAKLIGQVAALVEEQGDSTGFDAAKWFHRWAEEPVPALGGRKPEELLDTKEGQQVVANLLETIRAGAYS